jgi:hypothetical protein
MTFEEWWEKESGWGGEMLSEGQLAKDAWDAAIEECAKTVETQDRGANYEWISGSFWGTMTKKFAAMIRRLNT